MKSIDLMHHYREKALNYAAILGPLSASRIELGNDLLRLRDRTDAQMEALLHDFAFAARKYIEQAERCGIPMLKMAEKRGLLGEIFVEGAEESGFAHQSLWFALGRIIHSDSLVIERARSHMMGTDPPEFAENPWRVRVRSDRDEAELQHGLFIEQLVGWFLHVDRNFESDVKARRA